MNKKGQILIIIMIVLAIVSIVLVSVSRNIRRDSLNQIQLEQYEDSYSVLEQELLKLASNTNEFCNMDALDNGDCQYSLMIDSNRNQREQNVTFYMQKEDVINFIDFPIDKDKNISIKLPSTGVSDDFVFRWSGEVAWMVNIDYKLNEEYKTVGNVYVGNTSGLINEQTNIVNCLVFNREPAGEKTFGFNINSCLSALSNNGETIKPLALRLKPLARIDTKAELSLLEPTSGLPPQISVIRADADFGTSNPDTPGIQLELQIPLQNPYFEFLDYALRTNKIVKKAT